MAKTVLKRGFSVILAAGLVAASALTAFAAPGDDAWGEPPEGFTFEAYSAGPKVYATPDTGGGTGAAKSEWQDAEPQTAAVDLFKQPKKMLEILNRERENAGLPALILDESLTEAAQIRAVELETLYSHTRPNGEKCSTVLEEVSPALKAVSENISWGQKDADAAMTAWMNSEGHRANILSEKPQYVGIAVHQKANGNLCWVQIFAKDK